MISRDEYLNVLKRFKDKALIKVITGIRRCGKSTLLEMFQDYLKENGVEESQIISINLEDLEYNFITDYMTLYKYINDKLKEKKKYYIFIDEVQKIDEFQKAVSDIPADDAEHNCTIASGVAVAPILTEMVDIAQKKWHNLHCRVVPIVNHFFGEDINVTGLITGGDLISQLKGKPLGDKLLLSANMFRSEGDIMLDDTSVQDIEDALGVKVEPVQSDGYELLCAMLECN